MHVVDEHHAINQDHAERVKYIGFTAFVGLLLLLNVTGLFRYIFGIDTAIFLTLLAGYKTFYRAIGELLEKRISADLAICVAAVAALSVGEYLAAAEAMFIMLLGEGLEAYAAGRTQAAIHRFVEQLPRRARVLRDELEIEVPVEDLVPGDTIVVRAGERISADGLIGAGQSSIDESPITGESVPRDKGPGEEVYSGTLNGHGLLHIRVTHAGEDSTIARVVHLVEQAKQRKAPVVRLADHYAQLFSAGAIAGRRRHAVFHRRLAAHGGGADRRLPLRLDSGDAGGDGRGDRRVGAARDSGARRGGAANRRQGRHSRLRQDRHADLGPFSHS